MRFQIASGFGIGEDDPAQRRTVQPTVGGQHVRTEALDHRGETRRAGFDHLPRQHVGVDHHRPALTEHVGDGRLPRRDPTGQSHPQHERQRYGADRA